MVWIGESPQDIIGPIMSWGDSSCENTKIVRSGFGSTSPARRLATAPVCRPLAPPWRNASALGARGTTGAGCQLWELTH